MRAAATPSASPIGPTPANAVPAATVTSSSSGRLPTQACARKQAAPASAQTTTVSRQRSSRSAIAGIAMPATTRTATPTEVKSPTSTAVSPQSPSQSGQNGRCAPVAAKNAK